MIGVLFNELNIQASFFIGGIADDALGEKLILVVDTVVIDSEKQRLILNKLKELLPKYHVPKEIQTISFAYTDSGKIDRKKTVEKIKL
jgi:O-succinylbenzoic acid--CoA ligase